MRSLCLLIALAACEAEPPAVEADDPAAVPEPPAPAPPPTPEEEVAGLEADVEAIGHDLAAIHARREALLQEIDAAQAALPAEDEVLRARLDAARLVLAATFGEEEPEEARPVVRPRPAPPPPPEPAVPSGPAGTLQIAAPARGRAIWVDGEKTPHVTPAVFEVAVGPHEVKVDGYAARTVEVEEKERELIVLR